ncbi:MAG: phytanoyl-CoA dioxygenase family protein [Alphaproteobacteria bacterium]|nr:phytanoyl-CoA dioxygenase family protein [Alphaproteobacteria bacterium]
MTATVMATAALHAARERFRRDGHVTLAGIFDAARMDAAGADADAFASDVIAGLDAAARAKHVETGGRPRWIDHPVRHRPLFRRLAAAPALVAAVETLIGPGVDVYFSQIFFKPPLDGSPKPAHQDNFYAGPNDPDGLVTAWIALDEATPENGCLEFVDGSHRGPIHPHAAPPGQPHHLQIAAAILDRLAFTAAPVPKGGVSFHHGGTIHRSAANRSARARRAAAITYVTKTTRFDDPRLNYDPAMRLPVT